MRSWVRWQDWLNVVVGLWLFVSPWVLGTTGMAAVAWSAWIVGALILIAALWALASPASSTAEWCAFALGLAAICAPWVLSFSNLASPMWSFVISGLIVLGISVWLLVITAKGPEERMV